MPPGYVVPPLLILISLTLCVFYAVLCGISSLKCYRYHPFLREQTTENIPTLSRPRSHTAKTRYSTKDPLLAPRYYWPNYGYEPYWAGGKWALHDPMKDLPPNASTTKVPLVCGEECGFMHMRIKEVCGHKSDRFRFGWCWNIECYGEKLKDVFTQYFRTFPTYCEFLDHQCRNYEYERWGLLHRGPCVEYYQQHTFLKQLMPQTAIVSRSEFYLTHWKEVFNNMSQNQNPTEEPKTTMSTPGG